MATFFLPALIFLGSVALPLIALLYFYRFGMDALTAFHEKRRIDAVLSGILTAACGWLFVGLGSAAILVFTILGTN